MSPKEARIMFTLICILFIIAGIVAVFKPQSKTTVYAIPSTELEVGADFVIIDGTNLVYDPYTEVVYLSNKVFYNKYVYTEYLSENMNHYKYIDGTVVEVDDNGDPIE